MKVRYFVALLLAAGMLQPGACAQTRAKAAGTKSKAPSVSQVVTQLPENVFELTEIPANYRKGVSMAAVVKQAEALGSVEKVEFEKSEEFKARQQSLIDASPLAAGKGPLGFVLDEKLLGVEFAYNADMSQYDVKRRGLFHPFCQATPFLALPKGPQSIQLCVVGILNHKESTYNGQNAFGVSAQVDKERGTYVSVSIPLLSPFFKQLHDRMYDYKDAVEFSPEEARKRKTSDLKMMLVGRINRIGTIRGEAMIVQPRIDHTFDVFIENKGLPFKLEAVIYFFQSDGKILAIRDMREPGSEL